MKIHLEEHEFTAAVAGLELDATAKEHLGSCLSCRQQVSAMRDVIDARRADLAAGAPTWERQRHEIMMRLPLTTPTVRRLRSVWTRPLLAVAAVLLVVVGLRALWTPAPDVVDPSVVSELPVEQILDEVDAMLADDSIPGFEVIDQGMDDAIFENGTS